MAEKEYIERDAAKKKHCEICMEECICYRNKSTCNDLKAFDLIPAADVRPVVVGRWEVSRTDYAWNGAEYPTHCKCTVCGREVPYLDKDNFCANCGADMRQTGDENV